MSSESTRTFITIVNSTLVYMYGEDLFLHTDRDGVLQIDVLTSESTVLLLVLQYG